MQNGIHPSLREENVARALNLGQELDAGQDVPVGIRLPQGVVQKGESLGNPRLMTAIRHFTKTFKGLPAHSGVFRERGHNEGKPGFAVRVLGAFELGFENLFRTGHTAHRQLFGDFDFVGFREGQTGDGVVPVPDALQPSEAFGRKDDVAKSGKPGAF